MKPVHVFAGLVVGITLGCGVGYLVGQRHQPTMSAAARESEFDAARVTEERSAAETRTTSSVTTAESSSSTSTRADARSMRDQLRDIAAIKSDVKCAYEAERLFERLTLAELPAAFAAVQALPQNASRSRMLGMLFRHWGQLDGPAALAATGQLGAREKWNAESRALEGWAKANPEAAWNAARDMITANPTTSFRLGAALREFSRVDLTRAMGQATAISNEFGRQGLRRAVIDAAAEDGTLESVVRHAMQFESPAAREAWIKDVFTRWGSLDTDAPMNALRDITDPDLAHSAMTGLLTGWGELDPRGAFDYALENRADPLVSGALGPVVRNATRYVGEAELRTMMASVVEHGAFAGIAQEVGAQIAQNYPTLALELASSLTDERQRTMQTSMALSVWSRNDFNSAAAYFDALPNNTPAKTAAFSAISFQAMRQQDGPTTVARWINGFSGQDRMRAVQSLISSQTNQPTPLKPEAAAALAQVVAATPGLPPEAMERAKKLFGPVQAP